MSEDEERETENHILVGEKPPVVVSTLRVCPRGW